MKFKILSKKGAAIGLSVMLAMGSFVVSANELLGGANFAETVQGSSDQGGSDQGGSDQGGSDQTVEVTSIVLSQTALALKTGQKATLTATVKPDDATNPSVTWKSENPAVAAVENGTVTAVGTGTAVITAQAGDKTAKCTVTVTAPVINVSGITLSNTSLSLKAGASAVLTATVTPADASDKTVTWTSGNPSVATVSGGVVKAAANGTAVITAQAGDKKATCTVTVTTDATGVKLSKTSVTIVKGKTGTLTASVLPSTASNKTVTWKSSNTKIAAVDAKGKVTAKKAGTATITATASNGKKATCKVTVAEVKLNASSIPVQVGKTTTALKVETKYPSGDSVKSWSSSNKKIVTVDKKGKIKGVKKGTATVTVTMKSGAKDTCKVTVQKGKVVTKSLSVSDKKLTLVKGKSDKLTVKRNPVSATEKITWSSSNSKIASVDKNGKVSAKKAGTATITAKSSNGKKASCKVTVKNPTVTLSRKSATVLVGKTTTIKVKSTYPSKETVTYKSSNTKVATVDKKGKVTGKKAGTATITVTSKSKGKATFKVTVKKPTVTLSKKSASVKVGKTTTIKVKSTYPSKETVTYKSSNKKVATVDKKGKVTGKKAGKAKITVTSKSGGKTTFTVTVKK